MATIVDMNNTNFFIILLLNVFIFIIVPYIECYATALHYAPCQTDMKEGFRVAVVLPKGTNTDKPEYKAINKEDALLTARNKWIVELTGGPVVLTESDIA